jgi:hypothetical protein
MSSPRRGDHQNKAAIKRVSIKGREAKNYSLAGGSSVVSMGA